MKLLLVWMMVSTAAFSQKRNVPKPATIRVLEFRNYILQPGQRDAFIDYFNQNIVPQQEALGGFILNEFNLEDSADNFVWLRGFQDINARSKCLKDFYSSEYWKSQRARTNSMLMDSYNVHLLRPVVIHDGQVDQVGGVETSEFEKWKGFVVAEFFYTRDKRDELITLFAKDHLKTLASAGIVPTLWIAETAYNDYPWQHVYQKTDMLLVISHYKDKADFLEKRKIVEADTSSKMRDEMNALIMRMHTEILHSSNRR